MAARRMFLKSFIQDDVFALLPFSAQALYLRLAIEADDDGFVNNSKTIIRLLGVGDEDLDLLVEKKLLIKFDSGIVVIRHWRCHNHIRKDRYSTTKCLEERKSLIIREDDTYEIRPSGIPMETNWQPNDNQVATNRQPTDNQVATQYSIGKDSLDKDSLDKCSIGKVSIVEDNIGNDYIADATTTTTTTEQNNFNSFTFSAGAEPTQESYQGAEPQNIREPKRADSNTDTTNTDSTTNTITNNTSTTTADTPPMITNNTSTTIADTPPMRANNAITSDINDELAKKRAKKAPEEKKMVEALPNAFIEGEDTLRQISGPGKDVVYLTNRQVSALINEMGYRLYSLYIEKLANFIIEKKANIKSHYDTILKWYKEDWELPYRKAIAKEEQQKVRYGDFDPAKVMAEKIKESMELGRLEAEEMNL